MDQNKISIDRIALNSRGIAPQVARGAVDGLGQEVMNNSVQQDLFKSGQTIQLGDLNLGTLSLQRMGNAQELRREIARVITNAIATRIRRK